MESKFFALKHSEVWKGICFLLKMLQVWSVECSLLGHHHQHNHEDNSRDGSIKSGLLSTTDGIYTPALFLEKQILDGATDIEISVKIIYWGLGIIHGNFPVTKSPSFK